jgi:hypothetical protein
MTNKDQEHDDLRLRGPGNSTLDRELDAALAKYAAVEPRAGLEERILANLHAARTQVPEHRWWYWGVAVALAAVLLVVVTLTWKSGRSTPPQIVQNPSPTQKGPRQSPPQVAANNEHESVTSISARPRRSVHNPQAATVVAVAANPKLDVFPSPQPLSEQEQILADYVAQFHDQAVLIARVTSEELERDRIEVFGKSENPDEVADQPTTNR